MKPAGASGRSLFPVVAWTRNSIILWSSYALACLLPAALVWDIVRNLFLSALQNETYSHIPLVPLVSLTFAYLERRNIFSRPAQGWKIAGATAVIGIAVLALARWNPWHWSLVNWTSVVVLGFILVWAGVFGVWFGELALRAAFFPFFFLLFAVPMPAPLLSEIIGLLQRGSAEGVNVLFHAFRIPFARQGFDFALPGITIRVAEECSGIRSTLALVMAAVLAGHLWLRSFPRTLALCVAVIPIAMAKNAFRIAVLSWLAVYVDPQFLLGSIHHRYGGILFFGFGMLMMGFVLVGLRRLRFPQPEPSR